MGLIASPGAGGVNGISVAESAYTNGTSATESHRVYVPVLIIGGGPTGLLQAHLLSRLGGKYAGTLRSTKTLDPGAETHSPVIAH